MLKKGFTLIELIIVIGVIGILATLVLVTLDPVEQINRANDTKLVAAAKSLADAAGRFYAQRQAMPWGATDPNVTAGSAEVVTLSGGAGATALTALKNAGELKSTFDTGITTTSLSIYGTTSTGLITVCYKPVSKAMVSDPDNNKEANGNAAGTGTSPNNTCATASTAGCFTCISNQ